MNTTGPVSFASSLALKTVQKYINVNKKKLDFFILKKILNIFLAFYNSIVLFCFQYTSRKMYMQRFSTGTFLRGGRQFFIFISNNEFETWKWHEHHCAAKTENFSLGILRQGFLKFLMFKSDPF